MRSFSPPKSDFAAQVTLSARRGAEHHAVVVVDVIVVVTAVAVDIVCVIVVVSRTQPPPSSRAIVQHITYMGKSLYLSLSFFNAPLTRRIS